MAEADEALQHFQKVKEQYWSDMWAGESDDDSDDVDEPLSDEDIEKRRIARNAIWKAWRAHVDAVGPEVWNDYEAWYCFAGGDVSDKELVDGERQYTPEFQHLLDTYGKDAWVIARFFLSDQLQERIDEGGWPDHSDESYIPTLKGQPYLRGLLGGGRYPPPGSELLGVRGHVGAEGVVRWGIFPGGPFQSAEAILRFGETGIDWVDKRIIRKSVFGLIPWATCVGFASKGLTTIVAQEDQERRFLVEFEAAERDDSMRLYALARVVLPGPEKGGRRRGFIEQSWRPLGERWGDHWWVWTGERGRGGWIIRYLFQRERALLNR